MGIAILSLALIFSGCSKLHAARSAATDKRFAKAAPPICRSSVMPGRLDFEIRDQTSNKNLRRFLSDQARFRNSIADVNLRPQTYLTPTQKVPVQQWPSLVDDLNFSQMQLAIRRQIQRYQQIGLNGYIRLGSDLYPLSQAEKSLEVFSAMVKEVLACETVKPYAICQSRFEKLMKEKFNLYAPTLSPGDTRYGQSEDALFTGYYTPSISVSAVKTTNFSHAIYADPENSTLRSSSRDQIDFHHRLSGHHLSLFYAGDLFSIYLAQIQGNAHVYVTGASPGSPNFYLNYVGTNGLAWRFISEYMYEKHYINDTTIYSQHKFLEEHPDKQEEIYSTCPSYVYFKKTSEQPLGSDGVPVTQNRSIATDPNYYAFKGLLTFIQSQRPTHRQDLAKPCVPLHLRDFSRFVLDQDVGGAIRGKARADIYFGEGAYAQLAAFNEDNRGNIYFLMLKK